MCSLMMRSVEFRQFPPLQKIFIRLKITKPSAGIMSTAAADKYPKADKLRLVLNILKVHSCEETRKYLETVPRRFEFVLSSAALPLYYEINEAEQGLTLPSWVGKELRQTAKTNTYSSTSHTANNIYKYNALYNCHYNTNNQT